MFLGVVRKQTQEVELARGHSTLKTTSLQIVVLQTCVKFVNEQKKFVFVDLHDRSAEGIQSASSLHPFGGQLEEHSELTSE